MVLEAENPIVLSFTNKAVENVKNWLTCKEEMSKEDANKTCFTFASFLCEWKGRNISNLETNRYF